MKTKEIEGKQYVEIDMAKELKYQKTKEIVFLILIALAVFALVFTIVTLIKSKDVINRDALIIGMDKHGFVSCQCLDENYVEWRSEGGGFSSDPIERTNVEDILYEMGIGVVNGTG